MPTISYTVERGEEAFELLVDYEVAAYDPGNTYGLPEDCEPPSGGEVESLSVAHNGKAFVLTDAESAALERHIYETHDYSEFEHDDAIEEAHRELRDMTGGK
jgi:hypothetical protein